MVNFNEGDSRQDLNCPEIPDSWNNGEIGKNGNEVYLQL